MTGSFEAPGLYAVCYEFVPFSELAGLGDFTLIVIFFLSSHMLHQSHSLPYSLLELPSALALLAHTISCLSYNDNRDKSIQSQFLLKLFQLSQTSKSTTIHGRNYY